LASLYTDNDIDVGVAETLRAMGHIVVTARDLHTTRVLDDEHLLIAAERQWIFVTKDKGFRTLHDAWRRWSRAWNVTPTHSGILILHGEWLRVRATQEIFDFLDQGPPLTNELDEYFMGTGWTRRP
jgi:hypothetical protein